jgi:hypothetical protein
MQPIQPLPRIIIGDPKLDQLALENMHRLKHRTDELFANFVPQPGGGYAFVPTPGQTRDIGDVKEGKFLSPKGAPAIGHSHPEKGGASSFLDQEIRTLCGKGGSTTSIKATALEWWNGSATDSTFGC